MEGKSAIQKGFKMATHKTSLLLTEKSSIPMKVKKSSNKLKKGFEEIDDMGSLILLKNGAERKKLNGIDERIKLLKTELTSLLGDKKLDKDCNSFTDNQNVVICTDLKNVDEISQVVPKVLDSNYNKSPEFCKEFLLSDVIDSKLSTSSIPFKFSDWLDKTIDEMDSKPEIDEKNLITNSTPLYSKLQSHSNKTSLSPLSLASDFKSKIFNISLLPQDQVEKLLYKSFVMQNSEIYLSSSEDSGQECVKSTTSKTKQQKHRRLRKCRKFHKDRLVQSSLNKNSGFSQKGRKRRLINKNSFLNDVEVIDLDNSLGNNSVGNKEISKIDCEVLDIDKYDWNEPFNINEDSESLSDVELVEDCTKNNVKLTNHNLKFCDTEKFQREQSVCHNEEGKAQQKRVWECPVCFEQAKGQEVVATQCGHIFCRDCIENHSSKLGKSCPSCRSDLKDKPLITLFNF